MTVNLILYVVGYHYNFIQVNSTNFIVHNSYLIGTSAELNFTSACQFFSAFFASYGNHDSWASRMEMLADGIEPPTASV